MFLVVLVAVALKYFTGLLVRTLFALVDELAGMLASLDDVLA